MTIDEVKKFAKKIPTLEPYCLREEFKEAYEEMVVHTQKKEPKELLLKRRPNEPQDVLEYRTENYEPITYGSLNRAFDNINRIFGGINAKINYTYDDVKTYLSTPNFMKYSFDQFFSDIFVKRMIEDANGFLIWLPGIDQNDQHSTLKPIPKLIFSFNLIDWEDEYIVFLSDEKTILKQGEKYVKNGKVYYMFTKDAFYKLTEGDKGYILTQEYKHDLGMLPVIVLGGDMNSTGIYQSFFAPFIPHANEAIRQFSDWQALSMTSAHPIREEFYMQCDVHEMKDNGNANDEDNKTYSRKVEVKPISRSPYGTIQRPIPEQNNMSDTLSAEIPSVRFINQGVEYVKNAQESYTLLLEQAEDCLHLNLGKGDLSGYAKELDLQSHEDMLRKIGKRLFYAKEMSIRIIIGYIKNIPFDKTVVTVVLPNTFRVKTEDELMQELKTLKEASAPSFMIAAVARELAALRFSGDQINQKIFEIISTYDPLFMYSVQEKQSMVLSGLTTKEDAIQSSMIYSLLLNIAKQKGEAAFLETNNEDLYAEVETALLDYLPQELLTQVNQDGTLDQTA